MATEAIAKFGGKEGTNFCFEDSLEKPYQGLTYVCFRVTNLR
jgi:hypothetical protein